MFQAVFQKRPCDLPISFNNNGIVWCFTKKKMVLDSNLKLTYVECLEITPKVTKHVLEHNVSLIGMGQCNSRETHYSTKRMNGLGAKSLFYLISGGKAQYNGV